MKISPITKGGRRVYMVNDQHGPGGKRQRHFFAKEADARRYVKERAADKADFGNGFATIAPQHRAYLAMHLDRIHRAGYTAAEAADLCERHPKNRPRIVLEALVGEFMKAKAAANLRPRYLVSLRASLNMFLAGRRERFVDEVTPSEVDGYIQGKNGWAPWTKRSYLTDVRTLFNWAIKRGFLEKNPAQPVDLPQAPDKPPGILTVEQSRALVDACRQHEPTLLPTLTLCLFAGVRPDEARRMEWSDVLETGYLEVKAAKAKTHRRRLIELTPQLRAWLELGRTLGGQLPARDYAKKFATVRKLAGVFVGWPHDAMRHSFCSYHLAKFRNAPQTALDAGHSPAMLFAHYRELVTREAAESFFAIMPPPAEAPAAIAGNGEAAGTAAPQTAPRLAMVDVPACQPGASGHVASGQMT